MQYRSEDYHQPYDAQGRLKNDPGSPEMPEGLPPNQEVRGEQGGESEDQQKPLPDPETASEQEPLAPHEGEPESPDPDSAMPEPVVGGRPATEEEAARAARDGPVDLERAVRAMQADDPHVQESPQTPPPGDSGDESADRDRLQQRADELREEGRTGLAEQVDANIERRFGSTGEGDSPPQDPPQETDGPEGGMDTGWFGPDRPNTRELDFNDDADETRRELGEIKQMIQKLIQMQPNDRKDVFATFD